MKKIAVTQARVADLPAEGARMLRPAQCDILKFNTAFP